MNKLRHLLLRTAATSISVVAYCQSPPCPVTVWSSAMAGNPSMYTPVQYMSIAFPDVDGGGARDFCYREGDGIVCETSNGLQPGAFTSLHSQWTSNSDFGSNWSAHDYSWQTIQYADVSGDGRADVCGFGPNGDGIYCGFSTGGSFVRSMKIWPYRDFTAQGKRILTGQVTHRIGKQSDSSI